MAYPGGRLILFQSVLQCVLVYWFLLFDIPSVVLEKMRRKFFQFLWGGWLGTPKLHLASWKSLSRPRHLGGWGIKILKDFNWSLCAKSLWRCLFDKGLWGATIEAKYMKGLSPCHWFRSHSTSPARCSEIWQRLLKALPIITRSLC